METAQWVYEVPILILLSGVKWGTAVFELRKVRSKFSRLSRAHESTRTLVYAGFIPVAVRGYTIPVGF